MSSCERWNASRWHPCVERRRYRCGFSCYDICFIQNNGWDVNSYTLQMLTTRLLFSSTRVLRILFLSVSTSIFSLYGFWTITISLWLQFFAYLFISFYFRLTYFCTYTNCFPHLPHQPFYIFFLHSLDLSYLWPPFLFDNCGYDNPISSPKFQHPF